MCAHQLSDRAHPPSLYISTTHEPFEKNKNVAVYNAAAISSRAVGENGADVLGHGKPILRGLVATPSFRTCKTSFPYTEFCYQISMQ
jgi:hypothetical protein